MSDDKDTKTVDWYGTYVQMKVDESSLDVEETTVGPMKLNKRHVEMFGWIYEGEGKDPRMIEIPEDCDLEFITPHPDFDETWSSASFKVKATLKGKPHHPPKPKQGHHWIAGRDDGNWYFIEIEN